MKNTPDLPSESASAKRNALRKGIIISVSVLTLFIIVAVIASPHLQIKPSTAQGNIVASAPTDSAPMDLAPSLGPKTAPVTIIEYADFGCPTCRYWYNLGVLNQLLSKYGDQIRFVWRDYPVITALSPQAAEAGQCANEQGKFWEFHDAVYDNNGAIEASDLKGYAEKIGLNMSQFNDCVNSHRYRDRVNAEEQEAFSHGNNGAPFFLVNNQLVIGPQPLSYFTNLIDPMLVGGK